MFENIREIFGTTRAHRYHISEAFGNIPGRPYGLQVYGASNCHEWAWANKRGGPPWAVNSKTAFKADSYALVLHKLLVSLQMELRQ
jgi:hypothetical protein